MKILLRTPSYLLRFAFLFILTHGWSNAFAEKAFTRQQDVIYGHKHGMALTMDVFTPQNANGKGVICVVSSSGRSSREMIKERRYTTFLSRGYTVFAVVHGSAPRFNVQEMVSDMHRAVRFIHFRAEHFKIDPEQLSITGASAGGTLALLVAMTGDSGNPDAKDPVERQSNTVKACGVFFCPTDWLNFGEKGRNTFDFQMKRYGQVDPSFTFHEYIKEEDRYEPIHDRERILALLETLSPITHVSKGDPPILLIHGDADPIIPFQQAQSLHDKLMETGVTNQLIQKEGKGHGWKGWRSDMKLIVDWFDKHL